MLRAVNQPGQGEGRWGGGGNAVFEMEELLAQREGARGEEGEGQGCESQELINAQRTALTVARAGAGFENCSLECGEGTWQQLAWDGGGEKWIPESEGSGGEEGKKGGRGRRVDARNCAAQKVGLWVRGA